MKVYIVLRCIPYKGDDVQEVYSSKTLADLKAKELQADTPMDWMEYRVYEWDVKDEL